MGVVMIDNDNLIPGWSIPNAQTHHEDYLAWCERNGVEPEYDENGPIE